MIPGLGQMMAGAGGNDEAAGDKMKRMMYILDSMTSAELDSDGSIFYEPRKDALRREKERAAKEEEERSVAVASSSKAEDKKKKKKPKVPVRMNARARRVARGSGTSVREVEEVSRCGCVLDCPPLTRCSFSCNTAVRVFLRVVRAVLTPRAVVAKLVKSMGGKAGWCVRRSAAAGAPRSPRSPQAQADAGRRSGRGPGARAAGAAAGHDAREDCADAEHVVAGDEGAAAHAGRAREAAQATTGEAG
jgi:signal recognition particle subunit SRP54